jgi:hypothetical protein
LTERLEVLLGMVGKTMEVRGWWWLMVVNPRVRSEMSGSKEKIDGSYYHIRERYTAES